MLKKSVLWIVIYSVFVVIFNACFYLIGGVEHPLSVWLSYIFIHLSYLLCIISPRLARKDAPLPRIVRLPLESGAVIYFFLELIIGVVFILARPQDAVPAFLIQLIVLGVFILYAAVILLANAQTATSVAQHKAEVDFVKVNASNLHSLLGRVTDDSAKRQLEAAYDDLRVSPSGSDASVAEIEAQIAQMVDMLYNQAHILTPEQLSEHLARLRTLIAERNSRLQLLR
jgi:hypothetical protein